MARAAGERLASIGKRYGVSRERVRQITKALGVAKPPPKVSAQQLRWATKRELAKLFTGTEFDRAEIMRIAGWDGEPTDLGLCDRLYREYKLIRCGAYVRCSRCETFKPFTEHLHGYMNSKQTLTCNPCNAARMRKYYETHDWPKPGPNAVLYSRRSQLKKAGRLDEMPPLGQPYLAKPPGVRAKEWWANLSAENRAAHIEKMAAGSKDGWQRWRESLTPEQYAEWQRRVRVGAAAARAALAARRQGGAA